MEFLKAFLHKFLVTLCARRGNCSQSTWCWLLIADLIWTFYQKIYPISLQRSLFMYGGEWFGASNLWMDWQDLHTQQLWKFVLGFKLYRLAYWRERKNGEEVREQRNIQNKNVPEQQKMSAFSVKKCTLMRGCTNERFC